MNDARRKKIVEAKAHIIDAQNLIKGVRDDEQEAFDNLPESLQGEKGQMMEEAIIMLDEAFEHLDEATGALENIV